MTGMMPLVLAIFAGVLFVTIVIILLIELRRSIDSE